MLVSWEARERFGASKGSFDYTGPTQGNRPILKSANK